MKNPDLQRKAFARSRQPFVIESVPYRTFFCNNVGENVGHITGQKTAIVSVVSLSRVRWMERGERNG